MSYLVLARKWRPQTFDELTGQESISRILKNAISLNKVSHAYIFSGPRGVGKTTTARILAKALNCADGPTIEPCGKCYSCMTITDGSSMDVFEIDGATNTGVDNIRDLRERVRYAPSGGRYKVYIIDEAHMLSVSAFNALLKTLEEPPPHVIFVLATTDPKKIPATVLSRCQHLPFRRITGQKIKERLKFITDSEGIKATDSALEMIARAADGSMRDSLTILDQIASFSEDITAADIKDLIGITETQTLSEIVAAVIEGDRKSIIKIISDLVDSGTDLKYFTRDMLQFVRNLLIVKIVGEAEDIIDMSEEEASAIRQLADGAAEEHLALIMSELIKAEPSIKGASHPRIALEMTLIRLSLLSHFRSVNEALRIIGGQHTAIRSREDAETEDRNKKSEGKGQKVIESSGHYSSITDIWNAALEKIEEINHPLAYKLKEGDINFENNEIRIVFKGGSSVHADSVRTNISSIKKVIHDLSGLDVPVKIETAESKSLSKKELKEIALKNPVVKEALDLFEARIVDVIPMKNSE